MKRFGAQALDDGQHYQETTVAEILEPGEEYRIGEGTSCRFRLIDTVSGAYSLLLKFVPEHQHHEFEKFSFLGRWHTMDENAKWEKVSWSRLCYVVKRGLFQ